MLVVMTMLAALVAVSWPALRGPLDRSRLRSAAKGLRVELAGARLRAIESGTAWQFRFQPGTGRFELAPKSTTDGARQVGLGTSDSRGPSRDETVPSVLAHDVCFRGPETAETPQVDPQGTVQPSQRQWSGPIVFYPNGRTSNASIRLGGRRSLYVDVTLRGLTGIVKIGELKEGTKPRPVVAPTAKNMRFSES